MPTTLVISGQQSVTTAGTVKQFTSAPAGTYALKWMEGNAGQVFVGYPGTTALTTANGYQFTSQTPPLLIVLSNLNQLYMDATTEGDKICWMRVAGQVIGMDAPSIYFFGYAISGRSLMGYSSLKKHTTWNYMPIFYRKSSL